MNRRSWILMSAGAAALAAGAAWRLRRPQAPAPTVDAKPPPATPDAGAAAFWQMSFPTPDGGSLATASLRGQPLLLNFWGTWCPPCVKEMPDLDRFAKEHAAQGWRVLGLAVDNPKAVRDFLARSPVGYTIALAGFEGSELAQKLGNGAGGPGGLPFTVAFDRQGAIRHRKAGATTLDELQGWAKSI
jgi:thiol-disulfide isomerase/thioredoxin